jgi:hypothetical protein
MAIHLLTPNAPGTTTVKGAREWCVPGPRFPLHVTASHNDETNTLYVHVGGILLPGDSVGPAESVWTAIRRMVEAWQAEELEMDHAEALEMAADLSAPRYIAYVGTGLPGDMSPGMMPVDTVADAREYLRGYAKRSGLSSVHLSLYVCLGDADMWQTARDFSDIGIPFDYADYTMTIGESGGVLVERG